MQIGKAFSFPFEDKAWFTKLLLGGIISIVPILSFAWVGYMVQIAKNVIDGKAEVLPDWGDDFGRKFIDGLIVTVAYLIYALPALLVICVMSGLYLVPVMVSSGEGSEDLLTGLLATSSVVSICLICLVAIYALVLTILYPGILAHFAEKRTFASCFELGQVYRTVSAHGSSYFMVVLMVIVISLVSGLVLGAVYGALGWTVCIPLVVSMFATAYVGAVTGHLVGQYGAEAYNRPGDLVADSQATMLQ